MIWYRMANYKWVVIYSVWHRNLFSNWMDDSCLYGLFGILRALYAKAKGKRRNKRAEKGERNEKKEE